MKYENCYVCITNDLKIFKKILKSKHQIKDHSLSYRIGSQNNNFDTIATIVDNDITYMYYCVNAKTRVKFKNIQKPFWICVVDKNHKPVSVYK